MKKTPKPTRTKHPLSDYGKVIVARIMQAKREKVRFDTGRAMGFVQGITEGIPQGIRIEQKSRRDTFWRRFRASFLGSSVSLAVAIWLSTLRV